MTINEKARRIEAVALDVDGVLTDGTFWWGPGGEEFKRFSFADVMGISLASKAGLRFALISGEESPQVDRFAAKMKIDDVYKGCHDKRAALEDFMGKHKLTAEQVCFVGDDVNDIPALKCAGFPVAVASANQHVFEYAVYRTERPGGGGAVREVLDLLLSVRCKEGQVAAL